MAPTVSDIAGFLGEMRLFEHVAAEHREILAQRLRQRSLRKGQLLFRDGDLGQEMFLVRHGRMIVSKPVTGSVEQVLARLGPGDFFGEMSLFDGEPRSASLQAETDATLLVLDRDNLQYLIETSPQAAAAFFHALVKVFIDRLRASTDLVAEVTRWGLEATGLDVDSR